MAQPGPGPGPGLASPEAMFMHIDDMSTIVSPFPKKVTPHFQIPLQDSSYLIFFLNLVYLLLSSTTPKPATQN